MEKFTILSHNGEDNIQCYLELPQGNATAVVQILHGMCEFYDRYQEVREKLLAAGFAVCGHDHVGHGDSVRDENRYGYFGKKQDVLREDAHKVTQAVRQKTGQIPFFLLGHSMGSFVARDYIAHYGAELKGAVIVGTSGPNAAAGAGVLLTKLMRLFKGDMHRSRFVNNVAFGNYNKRIANPTGKYDWLSRDGSVLQRYAADKRCTFIFTLKGFEDMFRLLQSVNGKASFEAVPAFLPLLLMAGKEDPVGNYGKGVEQVHASLQKAGKNSSLRLYPDMRHEIFNEMDNDAVYDDLLTWLKQQLKALDVKSATQG